MNHLEDALAYIKAARVAIKEGHDLMAADFLKDAQDSLRQELNMPQQITVMPNVELCEALEHELGEI